MMTRTSFNPRPRVGGDCGQVNCVSSSKSFNPRPRVGGDEAQYLAKKLSRLFQSTPPRGGRPDGLRIVSCIGCVSIHAPAWGATWRGGRDRP